MNVKIKIYGQKVYVKTPIKYLVGLRITHTKSESSRFGWGGKVIGINEIDNRIVVKFDSGTEQEYSLSSFDLRHCYQHHLPIIQFVNDETFKKNLLAPEWFSSIDERVREDHDKSIGKMRKQKQSQKFWMVVSAISGDNYQLNAQENYAPRKKVYSKEEAEEVAEYMTRQHDKPFFVLEAVAYFEPQEKPVSKTEI